MRLSHLVLACSLVSLSAAAEDLKSAVSADYPALENLYRTLHKNPELSGQEVMTAKRLAEEARAAGFEVTEKVGGTGIVAIMKNGPGPTLMIRTDLDGLPVEENTGLAFASTVKSKNAKGEDVPVMHACGHDIHMTVWTGVARRLAANRSSWSGTLVMIGQPAEETVSGAKAMLADGLFKRFPRPDFNLMLHDSASQPSGSIGYVPGYVLAASDSVDIEVKGIGGHGASPQTTRDPVVLASYIVVALQTLVARNNNPFDPAVVTVGSIHGGLKHNIIGSSVHLQLSVRSYKDETRALLIDGIKRIAVNEGRAFGLPEDMLPVVTSGNSTPATYNTPDLVARLVPVLKAAVGKDRVMKVDPIMASEDFSEYGRVDPKIPSAAFWLGGVEPGKYAATTDKSKLPSLHSALWAPDAEPAIKAGVVAMTSMALDILKKP